MLRTVTRFLALGTYDGATDGVLQCDDGRVYRFELPADIDEGIAVTAVERPFDLRPMPSDVLDRLTAILSPYSEPRWPAWYFPWKFPNADIEHDVDTQVSAIFAEAGSVVWNVTTSDPWKLSSLTAHPARHVIPPQR